MIFEHFLPTCWNGLQGSLTAHFHLKDIEVSDGFTLALIRYFEATLLAAFSSMTICYPAMITAFRSRLHLGEGAVGLARSELLL